MTDETNTTPEEFDAMWERGIPVETATRWNDNWDEETWEEALLHYGAIVKIIYSEMIRGQTATDRIPEWINRAAQAVVREYMCRDCGYGIVDLGCYGNLCNDCRSANSGKLPTQDDD